jgi:hypothetical protein
MSKSPLKTPLTLSKESRNLLAGQSRRRGLSYPERQGEADGPLRAREGSGRRDPGGRGLFGEGCLAGQALRMATATAMTECSILRLQKETMIRMLHNEPALSELFMSYLLSRNVRIEEDLVDQLFNSSEKRLARILLLLDPLRQRWTA